MPCASSRPTRLRPFPGRRRPGRRPPPLSSPSPRCGDETRTAPGIGSARPVGVLALLIVLLRPVSFSPQFVVGVGVPSALAGGRPRPAAARGAGGHGAAHGHDGRGRDVDLRHPEPDLARAGRAVARGRGAARDVPPRGNRPGPGRHRPLHRGPQPLLALGLARGRPDHDARAEAVRRFYGEATPPERARLLDGAGVALVVLPSRLPSGWLGAGTPYRRLPSVRGSSLAVYRRDDTAAGATPRR